MGGLIAFEVARQLEAAGATVRNVALIDANMPPVGFARVLGRVARLRSRAKTDSRGRALWWTDEPLQNMTSPGAGERSAGALEAEARFRRYVIKLPPLDAQSFVIQGTRRLSLRDKWDRTMDWGGRAAQVTVHDVEAMHLDIVRDPHVQEVTSATGSALCELEHTARA